MARYLTIYVNAQSEVAYSTMAQWLRCVFTWGVNLFTRRSCPFALIPECLTPDASVPRQVFSILSYLDQAGTGREEKSG
jgi:hypothetical protein